MDSEPQSYQLAPQDHARFLWIFLRSLESFHSEGQICSRYDDSDVGDVIDGIVTLPTGIFMDE